MSDWKLEAKEKRLDELTHVCGLFEFQVDNYSHRLSDKEMDYLVEAVFIMTKLQEELAKEIEDAKLTANVKKKAKYFLIQYDPDVEFGKFTKDVGLAIFGTDKEEVMSLAKQYAEKHFTAPDNRLPWDIFHWAPKRFVRKIQEEDIDIVLDTETGLEELNKDFQKEVKPALMANFDKHGTHIL